MNDSGGDAVLIQFDTAGQAHSTLKVPGAANVDWEALAYDAANHRVFIGDIGNNNQARKDLGIYWFTLSADSLDGPVHYLSFHYPDQHHFPAADNFDAEGLFYHNDSLYLWSKSRQLGPSGFTKCYRLPVDTGHHVAVLLDSMLTQVPVTGAALHPNGHKIALMSYGSLLIVEDFTGTQYTKGTVRQYPIPFSQTEAIDWIGDTLYFTNEEGRLFRWYTDTSTGIHAINGADFTLSPNPANDKTYLHCKGNYCDKSWQLTVVSAGGATLINDKIRDFPVVINTGPWSAGIYYVIISEGKYRIIKPLYHP